MKLDITAISGSPTYMVVGQPVENFQNYAGKTVTVSFRVKCSVIGVIQLYLSDGTGTTLSATNLTTGWETISATRNVAAGALNLYLYVGFCSVLGGISNPVVSTTYIDSAMATIGNTVIPFVSTNPDTDLARCRRFYRYLGGVSNMLLGYAQVYSASQCEWVYLHENMRITPTVVVNNPTNIHIGTATLATRVAFTTFGANLITPQSTQFLGTMTGSFTAGNIASLDTENVNASITFSADI
jgi:hypothetical protein